MDTAIPPIESFRGYLLAIARIQLASRPWLQAKMDASDLVQQTLLQGHQQQKEFRGQSSAELAGWLKQILIRSFANQVRTYSQDKRDVTKEYSIEADLEASSQRLDAWLAGDFSSPSQRLDQAERAIALAKALANLPEEQRQVILLKHLHNLPIAEIATQLERSVASIAGLLRRGLAQLRLTLDE